MGQHFHRQNPFLFFHLCHNIRTTLKGVFMKNFIIVLVAYFLLSACAPSAEAIQKAIDQTQAAMPTLTFTSTSTFTPRPTYTPNPTFTPYPTLTPYPTNTFLPTWTSTAKPQVQPTQAYVPPPAEPEDEDEQLERNMNLSVASHCPDAHTVTFIGPVTEVFQVPANGYVSKQLPSGTYYYTIDDDSTRYGPQDLFSSWWELEICPR